MHSFKVLKGEEAATQAISFTPQNLRSDMPEPAKDYLNRDRASTSFRMSHLVAQQTGVAEVERLSLEERIEVKALEKLKEIQEGAYKEAYALGLEEGREKAYADTSKSIQDRLNRFDEVLTSIGQLKSELIAQNEAHIMRMIYSLAQRLAMQEIENKTDRILPILKQAIEMAQTEEQVLVRLSDADFKFIEDFKVRASKEFEFIKKLKFENHPEIRPGGCIVETNYGVIDASVDERIKKLWNVLEEKLPRTKDSNEA